MMTDLHDNKVTAEHLKRMAYLYIRQSTLRQVLENTESTKRQYALRERAIALGWPIERVVIIDSDLGQSAASSADREGFKRLVSEVGMGNAGIVLGLEVSRLARNCSDWHRLLEICALTDTLICDEDGLYNPAHFNDRLLLGLKGTMSEAELHILKARLQGGILNKARRGELRMHLPVGLVYGDDGVVKLDADEQVRRSIALFFETFERTASATATVKYFRTNGLKFPCKLRKGLNKHEIVWYDLLHSRALQMLHNPRYAGAFFYGRSHVRHCGDGNKVRVRYPIEKWTTVRKDAHQGYISWERYEKNLKQLHDNAQVQGEERKKSPPREGPALLQGIVVCGICGKRMTVRYHALFGGTIPQYVCQKEGINTATPICQSVHGGAIDDAINELMIEAVNPLSLDITINVQNELSHRTQEIAHQHYQQVQRARYEAELARRRYMQVDPDNRLVADTLEAEWNGKLKALTQTQDAYERLREQTSANAVEDLTALKTLLEDFPKLWSNPATSVREKKRLVRLVIEDVTLIKGKQITMHVRFRGGAVRTLTLPLPLSIGEQRATGSKTIEIIDRLLRNNTDAQVADLLNKQKIASGTGKQFDGRRVQFIRRTYKLKSKQERLIEAGFISLQKCSSIIGVAKHTLISWAQRGIVESQLGNDKGELLFKPDRSVVKRLSALNQQGRGANFLKSISNRLERVQYGM